MRKDADKYLEELDLDLSLTAFIVQYDDHIAGWEGNTNEKGSTFTVKNSGGEIKNKGIEVATGKILPRGFNLSLNYFPVHTIPMRHLKIRITCMHCMCFLVCARGMRGVNLPLNYFLVHTIFSNAHVTQFFI